MKSIFPSQNNYYAAVVKILNRTFICNNFTLLGSLLSPAARPILLVTGFSWIFAVLLYWIFSCNLMAFLTVSKIKLPFTTLLEMAEQKEYAYGWPGQTSVEDTFRVIISHCSINVSLLRLSYTLILKLMIVVC